MALRMHRLWSNLGRAYSDFASNKQLRFDVVVVGGGIVGMAAAREILIQKPHLTCAVIEKECALGQHQSGHNSGVIHAGIYYTPGTTKAILCRQGRKLAVEYLEKRNIPYKNVGKLIVATEVDELPRLSELHRRGLANGAEDLRVIESSEISSIEPHCVGIKALHSPHTGIVDWGQVTKSFGVDFQESGGEIILNYDLASLSYGDCNSSADVSKFPVELLSKDNKKISAGYVLCCAGLFADRIAQLSGGKREPAIIPVRGEYLELVEEKWHLVKGNIYPVPNPKFPFLGVHFTPKIDGRVLAGPNAVLAFSREGYSYSDISMKDFIDYLSYPGFRKVAFNNVTFGVEEFLKSLFLNLQVKKLRQFIPEISARDFISGPTGVRAQAVSPDGEFVDDFVFEGEEDHNSRILHCRNAPSPAATSSLAIAKVLAKRMFRMMAG